MGQGPCKNTIFALRDSRKTVSGENFSIYLGLTQLKYNLLFLLTAIF